ncbi:uncharacterized protein LOC128802404 isoform X2 [Vidua chalybeata]|uniref:uncharacterized protein LOC128802404 isoform X2 n=1 Tax=Vidua chalybeata TaxID=81927 RepID=UPI0023A85FCA|nr:uncharacterized protein LOC128802404 isoform X2 [Vidua chalybeata]
MSRWRKSCSQRRKTQLSTHPGKRLRTWELLLQFCFLKVGGLTSRMSISTFQLLVWLQKMAPYPSTVDALIVPQPWKNVWVTLAQALKQEHLCLATASAENPMSTCLIGIPSKEQEFPKSLVRLQKVPCSCGKSLF